MTVGTPDENKAPQALIVDYARNPQTAYGFNVASMAFNNHFFFRGINSNPNVNSVPSADLRHKINENFTSIDSLKDTFLATADAMFGPGFVWLVQTNDTQKKPLKILTTYIAGSPLSGAHHRRQEVDLNTHNPSSYQNLNAVGAFGANAKQKQQPKKALGGVDVVPLLCVNTWEHAWLHDYGVGGKMAYLQAWWDKIDWEQVRQYADTTKSDQQPQSHGQGSRQFLYN
ncbi:hypothetical protein N0V90_003264 [Kalmusia sp. IMI 367209]|nr:hypothetical protein N0V90_003264 [Kalmusia sp. IMI 367209]